MITQTNGDFMKCLIFTVFMLATLPSFASTFKCDLISMHTDEAHREVLASRVLTLSQGKVERINISFEGLKISADITEFKDGISAGIWVQNFKEELLSDTVSRYDTNTSQIEVNSGSMEPTYDITLKCKRK